MAWRVIRNKLPLKDNLLTQRVVTSTKCVFCQNQTESLLHLCQDCMVVKNFLAKLCPNLHLSKNLLSYKDFWISHWQRFSKIEFQFLVLFLWTIWNFRNIVIFQNTKPGLGVFIHFWKITLATWGLRPELFDSREVLELNLTPIYVESALVFNAFSDRDTSYLYDYLLIHFNCILCWHIFGEATDDRSTLINRALLLGSQFVDSLC